MQQLAIAPQTLALLSISACAEKSHNPSAALPPGYASRGAEGVDLLFHPAHVPPQSPPIPAHAAPTCIFIPHPTAPPAPRRRNSATLRRSGSGSTRAVLPPHDRRGQVINNTRRRRRSATRGVAGGQVTALDARINNKASGRTERIFYAIVQTKSQGRDPGRRGGFMRVSVNAGYKSRGSWDEWMMSYATKMLLI